MITLSKLRLAAVLCVLSSAAGGAAAETLVECAKIAADGDRLACFDRLAAAALTADAAPRIEETPLSAATRETEMVVDTRFSRESSVLDNPFGLTAFKPNYILPMTYNRSKNVAPFRAAFPDIGMDDVEAKFQISFKAKLWDINDRLTLWAGYTQENWWQVYNDDESAPFRETNYQPEAYITYQTDMEILGFRVPVVGLSLNHQSNGRGEILSRSWNRIIGSAVLERGSLAIQPRIWYRIPEDRDDDDNPDTEDYYGYGDLRVAYKHRDMTFSTLFRNNLQVDDNKGAVQVDWTFPLNRRFKGYVQYFYGYGESMIDYDVKTNRIGVGVLMTDWL